MRPFPYDLKTRRPWKALRSSLTLRLRSASLSNAEGRAVSGVESAGLRYPLFSLYALPFILHPLHFWTIVFVAVGE